MCKGAHNVTAVACRACRRSWKGWLNEGQPKQASSIPASLSARLPEDAPNIPAMSLEGHSGMPVLSPPSTAWLLPEQPTSSTCCHDKLETSIVGSGAASVTSQVCIVPAAAEDLCKQLPTQSFCCGRNLQFLEQIFTYAPRPCCILSSCSQDMLSMKVSLRVGLPHVASGAPLDSSA